MGPSSQHPSQADVGHPASRRPGGRGPRKYQLSDLDVAALGDESTGGEDRGSTRPFDMAGRRMGAPVGNVFERITTASCDLMVPFAASDERPQRPHASSEPAGSARRWRVEDGERSYERAAPARPDRRTDAKGAAREIPASRGRTERSPSSSSSSHVAAHFHLLWYVLASRPLSPSSSTRCSMTLLRKPPPPRAASAQRSLPTGRGRTQAPGVDRVDEADDRREADRQAPVRVGGNSSDVARVEGLGGRLTPAFQAGNSASRSGCGMHANRGVGPR